MQRHAGFPPRAIVVIVVCTLLGAARSGGVDPGFELEATGASDESAAGGIISDRPARQAHLSKLLIGNDGLGVVLFHGFSACPLTAYVTLAHCSDRNCSDFDSVRVLYSYRYIAYRSALVTADFAIGREGPVVAVAPFNFTGATSPSPLRLIFCLDARCAGRRALLFPGVTNVPRGGPVSIAVGPDGVPLVALTGPGVLLRCSDPSCLGPPTLRPYFLPRVDVAEGPGGMPLVPAPVTQVEALDNDSVVVLHTFGPVLPYTPDPRYAAVASCVEAACGAMASGEPFEAASPLASTERHVQLLALPAPAPAPALLFRAVFDPAADTVALHVAPCAGPACGGRLAFRRVAAPGARLVSFAVALSPRGLPLLALATANRSLLVGECPDALCASAPPLRPALLAPEADSLSELSVASLPPDVILVTYTRRDRDLALEATGPLEAGPIVSSRVLVAKLPRYLPTECRGLDFP
eukprot:tig00001292_g8053.t1